MNYAVAGADVIQLSPNEDGGIVVTGAIPDGGGITDPGIAIQHFNRLGAFLSKQAVLLLRKHNYS